MGNICLKEKKIFKAMEKKMSCLYKFMIVSFENVFLNTIVVIN